MVTVDHFHDPWTRLGRGRYGTLSHGNHSGWVKCLTEGQCRMCERRHRISPLTRHHLVPVSWFNSQPIHDDQPARGVRMLRNADANIVPLCRHCHDQIDHRDDYLRTTARKMLRATLSQTEIAFVIAIRGKEWLDENYPPRPRVTTTLSGETRSPAPSHPRGLDLARAS